VDPGYSRVHLITQIQTEDMFYYKAYGLAIASEIPLCELDSASSGGDVLITYVAENNTLQEHRHEDYYFSAEPGCARFWLKEAGLFVVREGARIEVTPNAGVDADLLRLYIQGMVMAMLLYQRGFCVLHASVIGIDGVTTAFVGHVGAGKSSLAAALHCLGHRVLTDDNAAIYFVDGQPFVVPAYPHLKLFPAVAETLGYDEANLRPLNTFQKKCARTVADTFDHSPAPFDQIFVLGRQFDDEPRRLSLSESIVEIIRNSVPTRWGHRGDGVHLSRCAAVAETVPVFSIRTFDTLESLPVVAGRIESAVRERMGLTMALSAAAR
jgi:hypothetical protein